MSGLTGTIAGMFLIPSFIAAKLKATIPVQIVHCYIKQSLLSHQTIQLFFQLLAFQVSGDDLSCFIDQHILGDG